MSGATDNQSDASISAPQGFQYQRALPISTPRLAIWLFLSTEIMFFTALIGAYIVLRFSGSAINWPNRQSVHVVPTIGVINFLVLLCSSVTLTLVLRNVRKNACCAAKCWLWMTIGLGGIFLGITGAEYYSKFQRGIYPRAPRSLIYDRPDLTYLSGVKSEVRRLVNLGASTEQSASVTQTDSTAVQAQDRLRQIQTGLVQWTERTVGRSADPVMQTRSIEALAWMIYPDSFGKANSWRAEKFLRAETELNQQRRDELEKALADSDRRLKGLQVELQNQQRHLAAIEAKTEQASIEAKSEQAASVAARKLAKTNLSAVKKTAAAETARATTLTAERDQLVKRLDAVSELLPKVGAAESADARRGINHQFGLKLPMVISGGNTWVSTYFLLTGLHGLHVAVGILLFLGVVRLKLDQRRVELVQSIGVYWCFVDLVWGVLFLMIYVL